MLIPTKRSPSASTLLKSGGDERGTSCSCSNGVPVVIFNCISPGSSVKVTMPLVLQRESAEPRPVIQLNSCLKQHFQMKDDKSNCNTNHLPDDHQIQCSNKPFLQPLRKKELFSSSTSTVPLSSSELFYGNELSHHEFTEDITTGDTVTFDRERDKQKLKELDVGNRHMINRGGINRKAANFDKVTYDYEREEQHPVGNSVSSLKQFPLRTNGLKNNSLRGEQYFNHRNSAGREDDLVAMGTLWSPGQAQTRSSYISTSSCKSSNGTCTSSAATTTGTLPIRRSLNLSTSCSTRQLLTSSTSQPNATAFALSSMGNVKSSREVEPRYADPLAGAPSLFQQRLMELAALEAETVRWEKAKKVKKKPKQDS